MTRPTLALLLPLLLIGCGPKTQTFDVAVRNSTPGPLTVWLTKSGPDRREVQWLSPEDVSIGGPAKEQAVPALVILPGQARGTGVVEGKFGPETRAVLRVYRGQMTLDEMLATSRSDGNSRLDVTLQPGVNHLVVTESEGRLRAEKSAPFTRAAASGATTRAAGR